jgi:hypothetical protein
LKDKKKNKKKKKREENYPSTVFASFFVFDWIIVLALCREVKTGSKMPEANYLLSVSWGYIKVRVKI